MIKKVLGIALGIILLLTLWQTAFAQSAFTLQADKTRAQVGEKVTVSGNWTAGKLFSIKVTDDAGDIVYYGVVRADNTGTFTDPITVPDMEPGILTITAGSGNEVSSVQIKIYIQHTVTFNKNGGDTEASPTSVAVPDGEAIGQMPANPSKAGYTFYGWYKEKECQNAWDGSDKVTCDMTLYAKWVLKTYTVCFYQPDGKTQIGNLQTVGWGSAAAVPSAPVVSGYTFDQWVLTGDDDTVETSLSSVKENIMAVAKYSEITAKETATPRETPSTSSKTVTATPAALSSPGEIVTATPAASSSPGETATAAYSATPAVSIPPASIQPISVEEDKDTEIITIVIDVKTLPEGTRYVGLSNGKYFEIKGTDGTVKLQVSKDDIGDDGTIVITALNDEGNPIAGYSLKLENSDGTIIKIFGAVGILSMLLWIIIGLFAAAGIVLVIKILRRKKSI